jgi:Tol biopolymer transport system component
MLVFASEGNIWVLNLADGSRKQLTKVPTGAAARDPAWSPDGKRILYAYSPPLPPMRGPGGLLPLPVTDLYVMNADGSDAKVLVAHDAPGAGYETAVWGPDGQSVIAAYTALIMENNIVKDQVVEIVRVPLGAGARQTLVAGAVFPALAPDGQRLAFIANQPNGQALMLAGADGKNPSVLLPAGRMEPLMAPRFSPDGKQLVFTAAAPMPPVPTPTSPAVPGARSDAGRGLLARGRDIGRGLLAAATRPAQAHGLPMDVFIIGVDGSNLRRLTQLGEDSPACAWSPDGKRLAIVAGGGIYLMNADGSDFVQIDHRGGHGTVDWKR